MHRSIALLVAAVAMLSTVACTDTPPPAPPERPMNGLIPQPSVHAQAYANCLTQQGLQVKELLGVYVVVDQAASADLTKAESGCANEIDELLDSLGGSDRRVEDNDGNRLWYFVRGCMENYVGHHPRMENDFLMVRSHDADYTRDFDECIDIARAWPGESPAQNTPWPPSPRPRKS